LTEYGKKLYGYFEINQTSCFTLILNSSCVVVRAKDFKMTYDVDDVMVDELDLGDVTEQDRTDTLSEYRNDNTFLYSEILNIVRGYEGCL
jgi:hypothetical protein